MSYGTPFAIATMEKPLSWGMFTYEGDCIVHEMVKNLEEKMKKELQILEDYRTSKIGMTANDITIYIEWINNSILKALKDLDNDRKNLGKVDECTDTVVREAIWCYFFDHTIPCYTAEEAVERSKAFDAAVKEYELTGDDSAFKEFDE